MMPDFDTCYQAIQARDRRFDGWFFVAVSTTRIYCRPSCPAVAPKRKNVSFYPTAAAAQAAGYRACLRCRPDAVPGSPEWNLRADVAGRAMRLIADGVIDREGVDGLARRLAYSPRHLRRLLSEELGAGPLGLARAQRAQTARLLIETTPLPFGEVAFAAGFASVRQFNDTVRAVYALTPRELRRRAARARRAPAQLGAVTLRLPYRAPFEAQDVLAFLAARVVPSVEEVTHGAFRRTLRLPHGDGVMEVEPRDGYLQCVLRLADLHDLATAVARCRALFDLDADPVAISATLAQDPLLAQLVVQAPGRRVPGTVDGAELVVRAVLDQQASLAAARTSAGRLAAALGGRLAQPDGGLLFTFPTPEALSEADPELLPMPATRRAAIRSLAQAIAARRLTLDAGSDREETRQALLAIPGIGPWTASYVAMRALADPDAFPAADHGILRALRRSGWSGGAADATRRSEAWRPWRSYAVMHLWS